MASGHGCFPSSPATSGSLDVEINGISALRQGDTVEAHGCGTCPPHGRTVSGGSPTVFINGVPTARLGDYISCGGALITGSDNVIMDEITPTINAPSGAFSFSPFVRQCMKKANKKSQAFVGSA